MGAEAYAGHAGEMGSQLMMPHELMGGIVVLALLVLALFILGGVTVRRLSHIERRLQTLEHVLAIEQRGSPSPKPQN